VGEENLVARIDPSIKVEVGDTVTLDPRTDKVHLFHPETEKSLLL
jgi:multiple sugar transport system ATP-binding protein